MRNKLKLAICLFSIIIISATSYIYAATNMSYTLNVLDKYKILLDGQSVTIPESVSYSDGHTQSLATYHERLQDLASRLSSVEYSNGKVSVQDGKIFQTGTNGDYICLFSNDGSKISNIDMTTLKNRFEKNYMTNRAVEKFNELNQEYKDTPVEQADKLKKLEFLIENYQEDIARMRAITFDDTSKTFYCAIPFVGLTYTPAKPNPTIDYDQKTVTESVKGTYYLYSLIYRDLRLLNLEYSINGEEAVRVPDFDKDTYTYTVNLSPNYTDGTKINTTSMLNMKRILETNNITDFDLDVSVQEANVVIQNKKATAKVKVVFDISKYANNDDYTKNIEREYTINFVVTDYKKGDVDKSGIVDAVDASKVLTLFKNQNATEEELYLGDVDGTPGLTAVDAMTILTAFKNKTDLQ